jgi:hypothetical protein
MLAFLSLRLSHVAPAESAPENKKLCCQNTKVIYTDVKFTENEDNDGKITVLVQQAPKIAAEVTGVPLRSFETTERQRKIIKC